MAKTKSKKDLSKVLPGDPNHKAGVWKNKRLAGPKGPETTMMSCPRCARQRQVKVDDGKADKCPFCETEAADLPALPTMTLVDYKKPSEKGVDG